MENNIPEADAEWWRGAVIYQVYPRSFMDTDADGVGDLKGVVQKLDYIASLGVDGLWLSPFFASPMKDFGYDVSDYRAVDPLFGTLTDFDDLLTQAHSRGLKVIIDQVWSHTSDQHLWFLESAASRDNPKADWYVWADAGEDGTPPNNWLGSFGGPSWTWGPRRRQYYLHNFLSSQPDLNYWNAEVQDAILDVARFWLDRGVDGFRLDVINFIFHDASLADNPVAPYGGPPATPTRFQRHVRDRSRPEALEFISRLRRVVDGYADRMTVGEVVDNPPLPRQLEYTAGSDRLHTAYSFFLLDAREASPRLFAEAIETWAGADGWPSWSLGNHDVERFVTRLAHGEDRLARALLAVLLCMPGCIFLYQGEELGLPQAMLPLDRLRDPFAIAAWTGGSGRDGARTPMVWRVDNANAGFSASSDTWLPVDAAHRPLAVDGQELPKDSWLNLTRRLIGLRRRYPTLRLGRAKVLSAPARVLAFERVGANARLLCLFELGGVSTEYTLDSKAELLFGLTGAESVLPNRVRLPAFGAAILLHGL